MGETVPKRRQNLSVSIMVANSTMVIKKTLMTNIKKVHVINTFTMDFYCKTNRQLKSGIFLFLKTSWTALTSSSVLGFCISRKSIRNCLPLLMRIMDAQPRQTRTRHDWESERVTTVGRAWTQICSTNLDRFDQCLIADPAPRIPRRRVGKAPRHLSHEQSRANS